MCYDAYGNILSKNGAVYQYRDSRWKDKLSAYNGQYISYDSQGNPIRYLGHELRWEKGRQLKSFDGNTYTYNANGIRTSKTIDGVTRTYILDGVKILRETWDGNTLIPLYDNEESVCGILFNETPYYFQKNLQGDIIAITDKNGDLLARYTYDAWGKCTVTDRTDLNPVIDINPYRYRGYYYDAEIQMYYLQSRYYDPEIGRFVNVDEVFIVLISSGSLLEKNIFTYSLNSPVVFFDPRGLKAIEITNRLLRLMRANALKFAAYIVAKILFKGVYKGLIESFKHFYNNSKTGSAWDLKSQKSWKLASRDWFRFKGKKLRFDDPGNIHFGYVGSVMFPLSILLVGAGVYQIYSGTSEWYYYVSFFDEPRDSLMIRWGHDLFISDCSRAILKVLNKINGIHKKGLKIYWV